MIIEKYLPCVHAYADDTQLYLSFKPGCTATEEESIAAMENCIKTIHAWMIMDKMEINDINTEFLIIGMTQKLNKVNIKTLSVGDSAVAAATMAPNLGVLFDEKMTLLPHINNTCKTAFYYIHNIRRIRKCLSVETARTLVHAVHVVISGGVGAVVRSLPSNPKVPGSIPGSAETGIFGDLPSR